MSGFDNGCPYCGGILWHLNECPHCENFETEEYEPEGIVCSYCGNEIPDSFRVIEGDDENGEFFMCEKCIKEYVMFGALDEVIYALSHGELRKAREINLVRFRL